MPTIIAELKAEHYQHPIGIETPAPRLSWVIRPGPVEWTQRAYELEIKVGLNCPDVARAHTSTTTPRSRYTPSSRPSPHSYPGPLLRSPVVTARRFESAYKVTMMPGPSGNSFTSKRDSSSDQPGRPSRSQLRQRRSLRRSDRFESDKLSTLHRTARAHDCTSPHLACTKRF